jgi:hypothetical protein
MCESVFQLTKANQRLMVKAGQIKSCGHTAIAMGMESWAFISSRLGQCTSLFVPARKSRTKQSITNANLSLASSQQTTTKYTYKANAIDQYNIIRNLMSSVAGAGVKKRHTPSKSNNMLTLQKSDTVHMCDVDPSDFTDIENKSNFMQLQYDSCQRECKLSIKCHPFIASNAQSSAFDEFKHRNEIDWGNEFTISPGANLELDGALWVVETVDNLNDTVIVKKRRGEERRSISVQEATNALL